MRNTIMFFLTAFALGGYGSESGQQARNREPEQRRIFGTVFYNGKTANDFLVAVETKELRVSRAQGKKRPMRAGPQAQTFKWPIRKNAFDPEHIVVEKGQRIVITENEVTSRQCFLYNSLRQRMPGPFDNRNTKPEFSFAREEIGIVFYNLTRPHVLGYVSVLDHINHCFTDAKGVFEMHRSIPKGKYELWINHPRYGSWVQAVELPSDKALEIAVTSNEKIDKSVSSFWGLTANTPWFGGP